MRTILLVEDDELTRTIADNYLSNDYYVIPYETATRAIQDLNSYIDGLDLAIIDVVYTDFRSGIDVWRKLRNKGFMGPVIFFTGITPESRDYKQALFCLNTDRNNKRFCTIVHKPQTIEGLREAVKQALSDYSSQHRTKIVKLEQIQKHRSIRDGY